jgi:hypothetical protein
VPAASQLPVYVYLVGGAFEQGTSNLGLYIGTSFARTGMVREATFPASHIVWRGGAAGKAGQRADGIVPSARWW